MGGKQLGEYLRARRELVTPHDVGLPPTGRRRVPGLRREELAALAGISADYYLRLEQGRDRHPSPQVLDALARALLLDEAAAAHLFALAAPPSRAAVPRPPEDVSEGIRQLISTGWSRTPVVVFNRAMDVLAANPLASALSPIHVPGVNVIRAVFLDPGLRELYLDWDEMTLRAVAGLRALVGTDVDDSRVTELVGELQAGSPEFRRLWARHDVSPRGTGVSELDHPRVGRMSLRYERLTVAGTPGQLIVVHHAEPGSASEAKLAALAEETAGSAAAAPGEEPGGGAGRG